MFVYIGQYKKYHWYHKFLPFLYNRFIFVKIQPHDVWNMDETLAHIILPMLKLLRDNKHGSPFVDNEDVPAELRRTEEEEKIFNETGESDENFHKRWEYVLSEMIWAFEQKLIDWESQYRSGNFDYQFEDAGVIDGETVFELKPGPNNTYKVEWDAMKAHRDRMTNGFKLFGKYFECLWD